MSHESMIMLSNITTKKYEVEFEDKSFLVVYENNNETDEQRIWLYNANGEIVYGQLRERIFEYILPRIEE